MQTYNVKIAQFEGPFDLLLYFIERDELNIYDIPIAKMTDDFLGYIHQMQELNIELASEFILVAATLMRIKAKMLLPRKELNEAGEEIDPREELVAKLLEYKRYKEVLDDLRHLEEKRHHLHKRGSSQLEIQNIYGAYGKEMDLESINLYKLLQVFNKVLVRFENRKNDVSHTVVKYPYTIKNERESLLSAVHSKKDISFSEAYQTCASKMQAVFRFLSMLELIQEQLLKIRLGTTYNQAWLVVTDKAIEILSEK